MGNTNKKHGDKDYENSPAAKAESKTIDKNLAADFHQTEKFIKLLLLGAGESGKSTIFKQITQLYGKGYDDSERAQFTDRIFKNCIEGLQVLTRNSDLVDDVSCRTSESLADSKKWVLELKDSEDFKVTPTFAKHCKLLWADQGIQNTFAYRAKFQIPDATPYFFERIEEIAQPEYIPSYKDLLMCRARTTGIVQTDFNVHGQGFKLVDVGGQRSERKKWMHYFEDVTAVVFVAAISEYDQRCYEDLETNRIDEALNLFKETLASKWLQKCHTILFLNKRDLFAEKIKKSPLSAHFPSYTGGDNYDLAVEFIKSQFLAQNESKDIRIFVHVTCATDRDNVSFTFAAVSDILVSESLKRSGLT